MSKAQIARLKHSQISLSVDELPKKWYNILPDLPVRLAPAKDPEEGPSRLALLGKRLVGECLRQENSDSRWIDIPEDIRELYIQAGRPRPLYRAYRLEKKLGLKKIRLYYKREDLSPTGSHKVNTALAQAYYAQKAGKDVLVTETGAGQWGSALSYAASLVGLTTFVFWVRAVYNWKPERRILMQMYGANVNPSPSKLTSFGRKLLEKDPNNPVGRFEFAYLLEEEKHWADSLREYQAAKRLAARVKGPEYIDPRGNPYEVAGVREQVDKAIDRVTNLNKAAQPKE